MGIILWLESRLRWGNNMVAFGNLLYSRNEFDDRAVAKLSLAKSPSLF
jgi:hypothetical protein